MTVAIDYVIGKNPEILREVFGLQVAIFNWLKAFFRYGSQDKITFLIDDVNAWHEVQRVAEDVGLDPQRLVPLDRRFVQENYQHISTVFRADPVAQDILWRRETLTGVGYNFCGLAHAISGLETGALLEQFCLAPTERTDAIICPSRAVQGAIRAFLDSYADYLQRRFTCNYHCPIQLPVIPLGIDVARFMALGAADKRADQRRKLGLSDDDIVVLWVGRLSHAIKAHPLAMFQAVERAAALTGASVHFVMLGWFATETDEPHFRNLANAVCHKAKVTFVRNLDERFPDGLWAAGDMFLSLIDNMQESFGLTPIEAMAAGLPRVISDWDGYRDGVTHGEDGFLVPTLQPPAGSGAALSTLLLDGRDLYAGYLGKTALSVAIDAEAAGHYLAQLIRDPALRQSMAAKAKIRVQQRYDWSGIIPTYESFWRDMAAQRRIDRATASPVGWQAIPPHAPDPFTMYAAYPSAAMKESDSVTVMASADMIKMLWSHEINVFGLDVMIAPDITTQMINHITKQGTVPIASLFQTFPALDRPQLWRTLGWLIKLGILRHRAG